MISIFAKRAFLNTNPSQEFISKEKSYRGHGHLQRVSSVIRADQIVEQIGARFNPKEGYENDICIYVKPMVRKGDDFKFEGRKAYLDIVDGHNLGELAKKHPEVGVIVCSQADYETMSNAIPNEIVLIPQQHCNFERVKRTRSEITNVGVIGTEKSFEHLPKNLEEELAKRGMNLIKYSKFFSRKDIINFYLNIDIQIVWRPYKKILSNPLKIVNAMSFGIPTIALDEEAFKELDTYYYPVNDFDGFLYLLDYLLQASDFHNENMVERFLEKAEEYHIDNIAKLYKELDK